MTESDQIVATVRKNGAPVWYVVGKDEGHGFAKKPNQDYLQSVEVLFLRRYLLSEHRKVRAGQVKSALNGDLCCSVPHFRFRRLLSVGRNGTGHVESSRGRP